MRPTAVEWKRCLSFFGKWVMKHKRFEIFEHFSVALWLLVLRFWLFQSLDSLDPATKFHVEADPCWPFIYDIGFGPFTAATAAEVTVLMISVCRDPFNTQLSPIDPNWMMLEGDPKLIQILMFLVQYVVSPGSENLHLYIHQISSHVNEFEVGSPTVWQGFSIS